MSVIREINMMVKRAQMSALGTGNRKVVERTWKGMADDPNRPAWVGDALSRVQAARARARSGAKKTTPAAQTAPRPVQQTQMPPKTPTPTPTPQPQPARQMPAAQQTAGGTATSAANRMNELRAIRARMLRDYVNRTGNNIVPPEYMKKIQDAQEAYMNGR